ncbi:GNAT family N-acetyltransferase [uncultured Ruthenibacterium sp.]|uniref:GNAT family N-acetyltransferase n=1 Tax=uncultured Ruthenibacterium sp. TaxID=1905347 RepID=UPI002592FDA0|nr:GNAT family N-acetyltransferase [uncultured Ruthenibacterium sp.]
MEIDIRRAAQEDLDAAEQLYNDVCSALEAGTNWPGWRQGVYPTRTDARRAQAAGALYLAWDGARAIGSMVLNHDADPDYAQVPGWGPDADWPHLLLIHTLAVHPAYQGRGLARRLLAHAEVLARQSGMRALRLDVCVGNAPAIRLYEQCGFACAGTAEMHFCVGTVDPCRLYEKTL